MHQNPENTTRKPPLTPGPTWSDSVRFDYGKQLERQIF